jgi:hypothetical protein
MDNQIKYLLMVVGATIGVLWLTRPKNNMISTAMNDENYEDDNNKYSAPKVADSDLTKQQHDGSVGIKAMRSAIENGESKSKLDELNRLLLSENDIKVFSLENGSLVARNRAGKTITTE